MTFHERWMQEVNYMNDSRVRARDKDSLFNEFDEQQMIGIIVYTDYNDDDEEIEHKVEFPAIYEVCDTCEGKGHHVNPSIDAGGISREDFDEDPGFEEDYFSGRFDVQCYECGGKRVVPAINEAALSADQKKHLERLQEKWRDDAEYEAISRAERSMGA